MTEAAEERPGQAAAEPALQACRAGDDPGARGGGAGGASGGAWVGGGASLARAAPEHRADTLILAPTHAICRQANDTVRGGWPRKAR